LLAEGQTEGREESSRKRERHGQVTRQDELMGGTCLQPEVSLRPEWVAEGDPVTANGFHPIVERPIYR